MKHKNSPSEAEMVGKVFGRLTVKCKSVRPKRKKEKFWDCVCSCSKATTTTVSTNKLMSGHTTSCGCYRSEVRGQTSKKYNHFDLSGEYGIGFDTNGIEFYFDLEDYNKIKNDCWSVDKMGYVYHKKSIMGKGKKTYLHRLVMDLHSGESSIDHENRNKLDNRKSNLRLATNSQNGYNQTIGKNNSSGIIGVFFLNREKKWAARIKENYNTINLGNFENKEDAIIARLIAEKKICGEFAPQKHLFKQYKIGE